MIHRPRFRSLAGLLASGALVTAFATASAALAASGITVISPKANGTVPTGERPTFKMRVKGSGQVWVHVCKTKKKDSKGIICNEESIGQAKRGKGGVYSYKAKFFDFPEFWLNSPGTYYWQAHRIACEGGNTSDCLLEGPVVKFNVG